MSEHPVRTKLTFTEAMRLRAAHDQADAKCEQRAAEKGRDDSPHVAAVLERWDRVTTAVIPMLFQRIGAEILANYITTAGTDAIMGEWLDTLAFHPPEDAESHYQLFAKHMLG